MILELQTTADLGRALYEAHSEALAKLDPAKANGGPSWPEVPPESKREWLVTARVVVERFTWP